MISGYGDRSLYPRSGVVPVSRSSAWGNGFCRTCRKGSSGIESVRTAIGSFDFVVIGRVRG